MANFSISLPDDLRSAMRKKAGQVGMTEAELFRVAVANFLREEQQLDQYLDAVERVEKQLAVMTLRQEKFTRILGVTACKKDSEKLQDARQQFADAVSQIVDTVN